MITDSALTNVLYALPPRIKGALFNLSPTVQQNVAEIRLRKNLPLTLTVYGETVFLKNDGQTCFKKCDGLVYVSDAEITECFNLLCDSSIFAHENELRHGFVIMKNGCRAGVCGKLCDGGIMQNISSINIRICREIKGCANELLSLYRGGGLLIAGPPASGKTTMLRDFVRQLSNGLGGRINRVAVIDSRGEISGGGMLDLGLATDILNAEQKAHGVEIALRTMFPDVIAFDEIGNTDELKAVSQCFSAGVKIITTAHIESLYDLGQREVTNQLIKSGVIDQIAVLPKITGGKITVITPKELYAKAVV
ncbi:MAG: Flp pilus assembly complex ATPase component TadA [Clostridia bacterium]|nr:Flp pilus assembly complex ATPase component TadA [Clostridia bacterium]